MKMAGSTPVTLGAFACTSDTSETNRLHIDQNKMVWKDVKHCSAHRLDIQSMFERDEWKDLRIHTWPSSPHSRYANESHANVMPK